MLLKKNNHFILLTFLFILILQFNCYAENTITYENENNFNITIPKEIQIDAQTRSASYSVKANGNILETQVLSISPDTNFSLKENGGKNNINGIITQNGSICYYNDLKDTGVEYTGKIDIPELSAGEWTGNFNFIISLSNHEHNYNIISETEATCTEDSYRTYLCDICGYSYKEKIANATGHNYDSTYTAANELGKGYTTYVCKNCGDTYVIEDDECTHNYTIKITKQATCTENGVKTYTCKYCGNTYTEEIIATGHNYILNSEQEPTCTEDGLKTYICDNCGDIHTETILVTGHKYTSEITKKATNTENGEITHTCTKCDNVYIEEYLPFGQTSWTNISTISENRCC